MQNQSDLSGLLQLAQSPAGRRLLSYLQANGGQALQEAIQKAASGDYASARSMLSSILSTPQAKQMLQELEDSR